MKRWPIIITNIIDRVYRDNHDALSSAKNPSVKKPATGDDAEEDEDDDEELDEEELKAKVEEGKAIIARASKLKYEMARDRPLE